MLVGEHHYDEGVHNVIWKNGKKQEVQFRFSVI